MSVKYLCPECLGEDIDVPYWVNPNTREIADAYGSAGASASYPNIIPKSGITLTPHAAFCNDCECYVKPPSAMVM